MVKENLEESPEGGAARPASELAGESAPHLRMMRQRAALPRDAVRPTYAEVDLAAVGANFRVLDECADGAQVWPVLKADGYGHGAVACARALEATGARGFCVALLEEAIELHEARVRAPLLVMGGYYGSAFTEVIRRGLLPVIYDGRHVEDARRAAQALGVDRPVPVHVKVDTGMARLGVPLRELEDLILRVRDAPELRLDGLMTHFANADAAEEEATLEQLRLFAEAERAVVEAGLRPRVRHAANSAALMRGLGRFEVVRPGLAVYGVAPGGARRGEASRLRPAMRVRTEIVALRRLEVGGAVGYGSTFRAKRSTLLATVPMGYADGLWRQLSNRGALLVRGRRAPIAGVVSMDLTSIDVTDVPGVAVGDEAVVLGAATEQGSDPALTADEVAALAGAIPWEVLTSISRRVPRMYRGG